MTTKRLFITFASWEDRFREGTETLLNEYVFERTLMLYTKGASGLTAKNREYVRALLQKHNCDIDEVVLDYAEQITSWKAVRSAIEGISIISNKVIVDITTMPRNFIFTVLHLLISRGFSVKSVYHSPGSYPNEPLCWDPARPYLIFKLSGEFDLEKKGTAFIATAGFNPERVAMAIRFFDPLKVIIGFQKGDPYENIRKSVKGVRTISDIFGASIGFDTFEFNAYNNGDAGYNELNRIVTDLLPNYNIVMGSFGAKRTAAAMYKTFIATNQEIAFCYVPMREYDEVYSSGYRDSLIDDIKY
jgi:hypothetical protein